jgi:hypothetical protein
MPMLVDPLEPADVDRAADDDVEAGVASSANARLQSPHALAANVIVPLPNNSSVYTDLALGADNTDRG